MKKTVFVSGSVIFILLVLAQFMNYSMLGLQYAREMYAAFVGVLALVAGIWFGKGLYSRRKQRAQFGEVRLNARANVLLDEELSRREAHVLELLAGGRSNQEIADTLFVSPNTVKTHIRNLYKKLGVNTRTQAVLRAKQLTLID